VQASGEIPNPSELLLISDTDFDAFSGTVEAEDVYQAMSHAFRCANCDRLHVFWSGLEQEPTVYAVDGGER
jgi:hypothetical protein